MLHKIAPFALLLLLVSSCDRIDDPVLPGNSPHVTANGQAQRRVLLEEFTGHLCPTCPAAHAVAQQLSDLHGDRLVIVSEHVGSLAEPDAGNYSTDFRTEAGNAYLTHWYTDIIPRGLVDRSPYGNNTILPKADWGDAIAAELDKPLDVDVSFKDFSFNSGTNQVTTTVQCVTLNPVEHALNLIVQLTEDHVIDWQYDAAANPPNIPNYDHRHVLRGNLNGIWGEAITTGAATVGDTLTKTYSYTLPANVVTPANCALVAYVYSNEGDDQYEVKQVAEWKFTP